MKTKPDAIVIGSGFGGLATAIRLQAAGFSVRILEKRDKAGGRAYVYEQDGFTFDAGPTVITAPDCLSELFQIAGRRPEDYYQLEKLNPMYRLHWEDGVTFDYTDDVEQTVAQIEKISPEDARNYPRFLEYTRQVFEEGYAKLAHVPFLKISSMVKVSPQLLRLQAFRTVYGMVSKYIRHPHLRQAFSFHSLLVGGNPFTASSIYTLIHYLEKRWGVFWVKGGTHALVRALVKLFEDLGGTIEYGAEVERILSTEGRVSGVVVAGRRIPCSVVVSNGDVLDTYVRLLGHEPGVERTRRRLIQSRYSMSLFVVYFGTRRRYRGLAHHNILFGPRYRELLNDIFERGVLADDFSLYLHVPTVTDPSLAPAGCEAFYALSPVPHLGKAPLDWKVEGPRYANKILGYLEKHYLPELRREIVTQKILTPEDFKVHLNSPVGSAFSLEPVLTQSAYFRVHNRDPHLRGLYFVGAGTHPGAGIPGVVGSAKATAGLVAEDFEEGVEVITTPSPSVPTALEECRDRIKVGSKSFTLASYIFGRDMRDGAHLLYGWCRHCDDEVDNASDPSAQAERVAALRAKTLQAYGERPPEEAVFQALHQVVTRYGIPSYYALELIEGMSMDARRERYETEQDLDLYCYRVAGVVGLMMSHIMGVSDEIALKHAGDMGSAMQMTNIARDVLEDAALGRVYLPARWLRQAGVPPEEIGEARHRPAVARVVARLLDRAEESYRSGNYGLRFLPWRAALAVAMASSIYADIGRKVRARGARAWDSRAMVSLPRKLVLAARGVWLVAKTIPFRLTHPFRSAPLKTVWRHP